MVLWSSTKSALRKSRFELLKKMREIRASEAKTHFTRLLNDVESGETIVITRRGRRIARIVPKSDEERKKIERAKAGINELRQRIGRMSLAEILAARDEERR